MKGEVSISNWYLEDPKQSQVRVDLTYSRVYNPCTRSARGDLNASFLLPAVLPTRSESAT